MPSSINDFSLTLQVKSQSTLIEFLCNHCSLSKLRIKDALAKGALRLSRSNKSFRRIRKAKYTVKSGDIIWFCYSEAILNQEPPESVLIKDMSEYSIWFKPSGLLTQGNQFGDHFSLERHVEVHFSSVRKCKVVHRLDKDASGLVLIAHSKYAARYFSEIFRNHKIKKKYHAIVEGNPGKINECKRFEGNIDGKKALTEIRVITNHTETSELDISLHSGRKHQIRKHLSDAGYPIVGDRLYGGRITKSKKLQLIAYELSFVCPVTKKTQTIKLTNNYFIF